MMKTLTLTQPDDWHTHLRDGDLLTTTVPPVAKRFGKAIVMPNLKPPITTVDMALQYKQRIQDVLSPKTDFQPLMTLYLTDKTTVITTEQAKQQGITAFKLYPANVTIYSDSGVTSLSKIYPVLEAMESIDIPLLIHGEVNDPSVDIFDRETIFLERELSVLLVKFPKLRMVLEHISTQEAVDFVNNAPKTLAATITAHHLLVNRNTLLNGGIRPHLYCAPIVKKKQDQEALITAATSGNPKFFLGTDSAPHSQKNKETACGCAGIYTAHAAIELYAEVFEQANALDKLEGFASFYGADFYNLPRNKKTITLSKQPWNVPKTLPFAKGRLVPFQAGKVISWSLT